MPFPPLVFRHDGDGDERAQPKRRAALSIGTRSRDTVPRMLKAGSGAAMEWAPYQPSMMFQADLLVAHCRAAVQRTPNDAQAHLRLAKALFDAEALAEAVSVFDRAAATPNAAKAALLGKARALLAMNQPVQAREAIQQVLAFAPDSVAACLLLAKVHGKLGEHSEAEGILSACLQSLGRKPNILASLASVLLSQGKADEVLELLDGAHGTAACGASLLSARADALAMTGRTGEATALLGLDRFVRQVRITPPDGLDIDEFNARLEAEILAAPAHRYDPLFRTTRGGSQTHEILSGGAVAIPALLRAIKGAVQIYADSLGSDPHPFVAARPSRVTLSAWAVVLRTGGHQQPHIHPDGWMSGCYYVTVPDECSGGPDASGALLFHQGQEGAPPSLPTVPVAPTAGTVVLFPSHVRHSTVPLRGPGPRVCIAFDVAPL